MATLSQIKTDIRNNIIGAAIRYANELAGKKFLYVYEDKYIEVLFTTKRFLHLTSVDTPLGAVKFYKYAKNGILSDSQFYFNRQHNPRNVKIKTNALENLSDLTKTDVIVLEDVNTVTFRYKFGLTNLQFTLCLMENLDDQGNKIDNCFIPASFRINDNTSFQNSRNAETVDFIFEKNANDKKYKIMNFSEKNKEIPKSVYPLLDSSFHKKELNSTQIQNIEIDEIDLDEI